MKARQPCVVLMLAALCGPALAEINVSTGPVDWKFSGLFDMGYRDTRHGDPAQSRATFQANNTAPSNLIGSASIRFANDWRGLFLLEIDPDPGSSNRQNQGVGTNIFNGSPSQGQQYVGLAGPYGSVKLGIPDSW